jgi:signal transduction histidine kinase
VGLRKDGGVFPVDLAVSVVQLGDRRIFTGLVRDLSERKRLEQEILEISEREKRRIGQDLHDSLGQLLTGIGFKSKSLESKLVAKGLPEAQSASQIAALVIEGTSQARRLARGLQPVEPNPSGLMIALQELSLTMQELFSVDCVFDCPKPITVNDAATATNLYRIAQEACHNAVKHGRSARIEIRLDGSAQQPVLKVSDDGRGFDGSTISSKGLGLRIMQYRASMIGGTISILPREPTGTVVCCSLSALHAAADPR